MKHGSIGFFIGFLLTYAVCSFTNNGPDLKIIYEPFIKTDTIVVYKPEQTNVDALIKALAWVESRWNDKAESHKNARGYLQITNSAILEANRLIGFDEFCKNDAFDRKKSKEIFMIIEQYHNPDFDIHLCAKIWNPKANISYHKSIESKYNELMNNPE